MAVITEEVKDPQKSSCNSSSSVDMHAGAENHAEGVNQGTDITGVTNTVEPEDKPGEGVEGPESSLPPSASEPFVVRKGFRKRWSTMKSSGSVPSEAGSFDKFLNSLDDARESGGHTPSIGQISDLEQLDDDVSGPVMDHAASLKHTSHEFLSNVKWQTFSMPWETPIAKSVFSNELIPAIDLRQDPSWSSAAFRSPVAESPAQEPVSMCPKEAKPVFVSCIRSIKERTFIDMREKEMLAGLEKWNIIIRADSGQSKVGRQIELSPHSSIEILRACMGVKSPSTVVGRSNAMLSFLRWHTVSYPAEPFLPLSELRAWEYVSFLHRSGAPASRASAFIQSCRFAHFVLGVNGAPDIFGSGRIVGLSDIQLANKATAKQARPLSVFEMQQLHNISADQSRHLKDRVIASHLLMMAYCRCRHSDTLQIEDVEHDHSEKKGYIQLRTRYHKGSKTAAKKSLLLPIVASSAGVGSPEWIEMWWENRTRANLPVSGALGGPLLPAPKDDDTGWTRRPVTSTEISDILKIFLDCPGDRFLTSHSLKVTTLSWCSKGGVGKEHRRLLGRHSSATVDADSVYARDLMISPVDSLDKVMAAICEGRFFPDAPRSQYWPQMEPFSKTPVPADVSGRSALPVTPNVQPKHVTLRDFVSGTAVDVKSDPDLRDWEEVRTVETIEVSSSSSDSDVSLSERSESSSDKDEEPEPILPPPKVSRRAMEVPSRDELWWKHKHSKIVHSSSGDALGGKSDHISACGRRMTNKYEPILTIGDWTSKCRVCFCGRRQP